MTMMMNLNSVSFSCMVSVLSGREQILLQVENISPPLSIVGRLFSSIFFLMRYIIQESHFIDLDLSLSVFRYVLISMFIRKRNSISNKERNTIQKK